MALLDDPKPSDPKPSDPKSDPKPSDPKPSDPKPSDSSSSTPTAPSSPSSPAPEKSEPPAKLPEPDAPKPAPEPAPSEGTPPPQGTHSAPQIDVAKQATQEALTNTMRALRSLSGAVKTFGTAQSQVASEISTWCQGIVGRVEETETGVGGGAGA